jgi:hypothetical protein
MKRISLLIILLSFFISSCAPTTVTPQIVTVYATPAAQPWLTELYGCANAASVILTITPESPQIYLRVGAPQGLSTPSFQIDSEDILIVVNRTSPIQNLTLEQARALFAGQGDAALQRWVYDHDQDVQEIFEQTVMGGRSIVSSAKVAAAPQQMSDRLMADPVAVGILPRHWKMGDARDVYTIPSVPVLAITPTEPQGSVRDLIACMQK